jgi:TorA maturation chaperone TorD
MNTQPAPHAGDLDPDVRERLAGAARSRSTLYSVLAIGFSEPDEGLREALGARPAGEAGSGPAAGGESSDIAAGGSPLVQTIAAAAAWLDADASLYAPGLEMLDAAGASLPPLPLLAAEYARLFTGPGRAAVNRFASQYLDEPRADGRPRLRGPATEAAAAAYEAEGLAPRSALGEPADDIATELEFLSSLSDREATEWARGSTEEALRLRRAAAQFLREQCATWWPAFAGAVLAQARVEVYSGFARLLAAHLAIELGYPRSAAPQMPRATCPPGSPAGAAPTVPGRCGPPGQG